MFWRRRSRAPVDVREKEPTPKKEQAMNVDRFVTLELTVRKTQPTTGHLETLLIEWGLTDSTQERVWVISTDAINQVRTVQEVALGGYHEVAVPLPPLLTAVLMAGTDRFTVAHNHPAGDTTPTMYDVDAVHKIMAAANAAGLSFEDSLIVGPNSELFSFRENGLIVPAEAIATMVADAGHKLAS